MCASRKKAAQVSESMRFAIWQEYLESGRTYKYFSEKYNLSPYAVCCIISEGIKQLTPTPNPKTNENNQDLG
jgi:hypothetical protein